MAALIEELEYGDIIDDKDFVAKSKELNKSLLNINKHMELAESVNVESLSVEDRINFKLFTMFTLSSLCWIQLRLKGVDPNTHPVKQQLIRIRQLMKQRDDIIEKRKRLTVNKEAAKRFIRSGLWDPKSREQKDLPNKKIKFTDD